jgi:hypothetical protein
MATLTDSDVSFYFLGIVTGGGDVTDPSYSLTIDDLAFYRLQLQLRALPPGPPPYANCP